MHLRALAGDEFSLRVDLALDDSVHTVTVPTDGQGDAVQLQDIMHLHLETRALIATGSCATQHRHWFLCHPACMCYCCPRSVLVLDATAKACKEVRG